MGASVGMDEVGKDASRFFFLMRKSDAHLELAKLDLANADPGGALEELKAAEVNLPGSPLIPLYQAQAYLQLDRPVDALLAAQKASSAPPTTINRVSSQALNFGYPSGET